MAQVSIDHLQMLRMGNVVSFVEAGDKYTADTDVSKAADVAWKLLGRVEELSHSPQTEDDAVAYFDPNTQKYNEDKNTEVKSDQFKTKIADWSPFVWQLKYRTENPLEAGKIVPMFALSEPSVRCWVKVEKYDGKKRLLCTQYLFCDVRIDGEIAENNKLARPTLILDVVPSVNNGMIATEALTGTPATPAQASAEGGTPVDDGGY